MRERKRKVERTEDGNLPRTRWQLLKDTLRWRFWSLAVISLMAIVFYVPSFAWMSFASMSGLLKADNFYSVLLTHAVNALFLGVFGLGQAGLFYFLKRLAWGEGASIPSDFFEGIKKNWKAFSFLFFVMGLLYAVLELDLASIANSGWDSVAIGAVSGASYAVFFLFVAAILITLVESVIYSSRLFSLFVNAWRFLIGAFLTNVPVFLAYLLPLILYESIPSYIAQWVAILFEGVFYLGFSGFFLTIYCHSLFDKTINKRQFPEIVRKGLRKE
jgi:hypothetical protein